MSINTTYEEAYLAYQSSLALRSIALEAIQDATLSLAEAKMQLASAKLQYYTIHKQCGEQHALLKLLAPPADARLTRTMNRARKEGRVFSHSEIANEKVVEWDEDPPYEEAP